MVSLKRGIRRFHVVVRVQWTSKKCTKKCDASAELMFFDVVVAFVGLKLPINRLRMDVSSDFLCLSKNTKLPSSRLIE